MKLYSKLSSILYVKNCDFEKYVTLVFDCSRLFSWLGSERRGWDKREKKLLGPLDGVCLSLSNDGGPFLFERHWT